LIVLDASIAAAWLLAERPLSVGAELFSAHPDLSIVVPSHWPLEISNTLRTHLKAGRISISDFHDIMDKFDLLTISVQRSIDLDEIGPLAQFALTHGLTAYDAAYVQLALQHNATLATLDHAMRVAAGALNIALLPAAAP
jgi:predicted nucleic acid-binding protein